MRKGPKAGKQTHLVDGATASDALITYVISTQVHEAGGLLPSSFPSLDQEAETQRG
jgi:hypothetical protein